MEDRPEKERSEITEPQPLHDGEVRYEAILWGKARGLDQNGGYIAAYDNNTDQELWLLKVYEVVYDGEMEEDKQDIFIEDLRFDTKGHLCVTDERGNIYVVDLSSRTVVPSPDDSI